jgi:hypothetical protein
MIKRLDELEEELKAKANKKSTIAALTKKANKEDLDILKEEIALLSHKEVSIFIIFQG